jgi:hypothetical protein
VETSQKPGKWKEGAQSDEGEGAKEMVTGDIGEACTYEEGTNENTILIII